MKLYKKLGLTFSAIASLALASCTNSLAEADSPSSSSNSKSELSTSTKNVLEIAKDSSGNFIFTDLANYDKSSEKETVFSVTFNSQIKESTLKSGIKFYKLASADSDSKPFVQDSELSYTYVIDGKTVDFFLNLKDVEGIRVKSDATVLESVNGKKLNNDGDSIFGEKDDDDITVDFTSLDSNLVGLEVFSPNEKDFGEFDFDFDTEGKSIAYFKVANKYFESDSTYTSILNNSTVKLQKNTGDGNWIDVTYSVEAEPFDVENDDTEHSYKITYDNETVNATYRFITEEAQSLKTSNAVNGYVRRFTLNNDQNFIVLGDSNFTTESKNTIVDEAVMFKITGEKETTTVNSKTFYKYKNLTVKIADDNETFKTASDYDKGKGYDYYFRGLTEDASTVASKLHLFNNNYNEVEFTVAKAELKDFSYDVKYGYYSTLKIEFAEPVTSKTELSVYADSDLEVSYDVWGLATDDDTEKTLLSSPKFTLGMNTDVDKLLLIGKKTENRRSLGKVKNPSGYKWTSTPVLSYNNESKKLVWTNAIYEGYGYKSLTNSAYTYVLATTEESVTKEKFNEAIGNGEAKKLANGYGSYYPITKAIENNLFFAVRSESSSVTPNEGDISNIVKVAKVGELATPTISYNPETFELSINEVDGAAGNSTNYRIYIWEKSEKVNDTSTLDIKDANGYVAYSDQWKNGKYTEIVIPHSSKYYYYIVKALNSNGYDKDEDGNQKTFESLSNIVEVTPQTTFKILRRRTVISQNYLSETESYTYTYFKSHNSDMSNAEKIEDYVKHHSFYEYYAYLLGDTYVYAKAYKGSGDSKTEVATSNIIKFEGPQKAGTYTVTETAKATNIRDSGFKLVSFEEDKATDSVNELAKYYEVKLEKNTVYNFQYLTARTSLNSITINEPTYASVKIIPKSYLTDSTGLKTIDIDYSKLNTEFITNNTDDTYYVLVTPDSYAPTGNVAFRIWTDGKSSIEKIETPVLSYDETTKKIKWNTVSNADSYTIYRASTTDTQELQASSLQYLANTAGTSYSVSKSLTDNYFYAVKAISKIKSFSTVSSDYDSDFSNVVKLEKFADVLEYFAYNGYENGGEFEVGKGASSRIADYKQVTIDSDSPKGKYYSFTVTPGTTYYFSSVDSHLHSPVTDGTQSDYSLDALYYIYTVSGTSVLITDFSTAYTFTIPSIETATTYYVAVTPYSSGKTGNCAFRVYTIN